MCFQFIRSMTPGLLTSYWPPRKMLTPSKKSFDLSMKLRNVFLRLAEQSDKVQFVILHDTHTVQHLVHLPLKYRYITTYKYHARITLIPLFRTLPVDFQLSNNKWIWCLAIVSVTRHLCFALVAAPVQTLTPPQWGLEALAVSSRVSRNFGHNAISRASGIMPA